MTINELSQFYYLNREIEHEKQRLKQLRQKYYSPVSPSISGMPHGNKYESPVERMAVEITDLENIINKKLQRLEQEQRKLEEYIDGVKDSVMRQILTARFIELLSWGQVARKVGGNNTADSARMAVQRFLK